LTFQLHHQDGSARLGRIETPHGPIDTPVFMPVGTRASVKSLTTDQLKRLGRSAHAAEHSALSTQHCAPALVRK
jgi:tRNA-guanine family transglycosylase